MLGDTEFHREKYIQFYFALWKILYPQFLVRSNISVCVPPENSDLSNMSKEDIRTIFPTLKFPDVSYFPSILLM